MTVETWLSQAEKSIVAGSGVTVEDLQSLRTLLKGEQQHLLYIG